MGFRQLSGMASFCQTREIVFRLKQERSWGGAGCIHPLGIKPKAWHFENRMPMAKVVSPGDAWLTGQVLQR
jgi:hypothetical protein